MSSNIEIVTEQTQNGVYVAQFKTSMLAVFTYYIESNGQAYIIDPTYDYLIFRDFIAKRGAVLKYVVLTHYHADFIGGHTEFKVPVVMGPESKRQANKFEIIEIPENGKFKVGNVETRVISTPGHTLESACFILADQNGKQFCIFTGDTVFLGEVGRPDLAVASDISSKDLGGMLFDSIQKIKALDGSLRLYPGHGSGSACGKSIGSGNFCDLKTQAEKNYAFLINDRNDFAEKVSKDLPAPPKYFFYDAKMNQQGSSIMYEDAFKKARNPLSLQAFQKFASENVKIIDTRHVPEGGLIKGSYWMSNKAMICQLVSRIIEPQTPFLLIVEQGNETQILQRLLRVGYCNILGYNGFNMSQWKGEMINPTLKTYEQFLTLKTTVIVDVRNQEEWEEIGVFQSALLISLPQLNDKINIVTQSVNQNADTHLVVHCKTGMRARLAASILGNHLTCPISVLNEQFLKLGEKGVKLQPYKRQ